MKRELREVVWKVLRSCRKREEERRGEEEQRGEERRGRGRGEGDDNMSVTRLSLSPASPFSSPGAILLLDELHEGKVLRRIAGCLDPKVVRLIQWAFCSQAGADFLETHCAIGVPERQHARVAMLAVLFEAHSAAQRVHVFG